jgi:hypothetical protein
MEKNCSVSPERDTPIVFREKLPRQIELGYAIILRDEVLETGRYQVIASVKGGAVIVEEWHDSKRDDNWHYDEGVILDRGSIPKLIKMLAGLGYGPDGNKT